jgi:hypothetical protein
MDPSVKCIRGNERQLLKIVFFLFSRNFGGAG